ncbi:Bet v1-like protein [Rhodotorula sp. JG-1b]|nr:Bet v1-like protein [Rhodotorula sp. JG-1b]
MSLVQPPTPAVDNYPAASPYAYQIQTSRERFLKEISSDDGWTELGEKQGVTLSKKNIEGNPVPIVRGEAVVENVEPWDFLAGVIRAQELRKQWDSRYETGVYLQRFSQSEVVFHALTKGTRFVAAPRDIVGVQKDFVEPDGTYIVVQTSIETDLAQELPKTTRATLNLAGWQFKPEGANTRVVYLVQVALNGSIPSMLANAVANETPLCVGRARDVFYKHGFAPHLKFRGDEKAGGIVYQFENYEPDAHKYICTISTGSAPGDSIEILYDTNKVYTSGVKVTVDGDASAVAVEDNGQGVVRVESKEAGKTVTIVLSK